MSVCPKCGVEIDHLNAYSRGETLYTFILDGSGEPRYLKKEVIPSCDPDDYECPKCHEVLFTDEEEATKFLDADNSGAE